MNPNIFRWASSELSQDAFICWLLSWGNYRESVELYETARLFIKRLTNGAIIDFEKIQLKKQYKSIDILCIVDEKKVILIEDKVHTKHHGNQLERYYALLEQQYLKEDIYPVYFKTGDQSNYRQVEAAGYLAFLRSDFLEVLEFGYGKGITNEIFLDFHTHLKGMDLSVQSYLSLPVNEWHWDSWKGFYSALQNEIGEGEWDYVPQMNGGFLGFWWKFYWKQLRDTVGYEYYLQLEHGKFCFKLSPEKREDAEETRAHFRSLLYAKAREYGIEVYQNGRIGTWMTAAALSQPYIKTKDDGLLDMQATVANIRKVEKMFNEI